MVKLKIRKYLDFGHLSDTPTWCRKSSLNCRLLKSGKRRGCERLSKDCALLLLVWSFTITITIAIIKKSEVVNIFSCASLRQVYCVYREGDRDKDLCQTLSGLEARRKRKRCASWNVLTHVEPGPSSPRPGQETGGQTTSLRSVQRRLEMSTDCTVELPYYLKSGGVLLSLFTRLGLWRQNYQNMTESMAGCLEPGGRPVCRSMALSRGWPRREWPSWTGSRDLMV